MHALASVLVEVREGLVTRVRRTPWWLTCYPIFMLHTMVAHLIPHLLWEGLVTRHAGAARDVCQAVARQTTRITILVVRAVHKWSVQSDRPHDHVWSVSSLTACFKTLRVPGSSPSPGPGVGAGACAHGFLSITHTPPLSSVGVG